jgi:dihydrofolate synthase / folylpolyglutamate synthase
MAFLESLYSIGVKLGLDGTRRLLAAIGDPQRDVPAVHVAGTNGKGSVCALLHAGLVHAGKRTGLYTSPHLVSIRERIRVDGEPISEAEFGRLTAELYRRARHLYEDPGAQFPTFFETVTGLAMLYFQQKKVDIAVLEVGMGGRLDSTNLCCPRITVITNISFDHTGALGDTLAAIAREKAGIIKPGVPLVCGVRKPEALATIQAIAAERGAPIRLVQPEIESIAISANPLRQTMRFSDCSLTTALVGPHQAQNLAVAVATLAELGLPPGGLDRARWPARCEEVEGILIDAAHNLAAADELCATLRSVYPDRRWQILFASLSDKDWRAALHRFAEIAAGFVIVRAPGNRAVESAEIADFIRAEISLPVSEAADVPTAIAELRSSQHPGLILGSLYMAGEAYAHLRKSHLPAVYE